MIRILAPVFSLLFATLILMMGNGLQNVILPVRGSLETFSTTSIGFMSSLFFAGYIPGGLFAPFLIVRAGHIRSFTAMVSVASAIALLHPMISDIYVWWGSRFITGFCIAGLYLVIESWLNDGTTNESRGLVFSVYTIIVAIGIMMGQFSLSILPLDGFEAFVIASILFSSAVVPVALTKSAQPAPIAVVRIRPVELYKTSPAAIISTVFIGMALGTLMTLTPLFADSIGLSKNEISYASGAVMVGSIVLQYPIGRLSDFMDRRLMLLVTSVIACGVCVLVGFTPISSPWMLIGIMCLMGAMLFPLYSVAAAHAYDHADPETTLETASGLQLAFGVGSSIGPYVISVFMQKFGPQAMFFALAIIVGLMALHLLFRMNVRSALSDDDKTDYDYASTAAVGGFITPEGLEEYDVEEDVYFLVPDEYDALSYEDPYDDDTEGTTSERRAPEGLDDEGTPF